MQNSIFSKNPEISGSETFISDDFISSRKCSNLMVDPALDSLESELLNALFDVITALFSADLSRKKCRDPLKFCFRHITEFCRICAHQTFWLNIQSLFQAPRPRLGGVRFMGSDDG